jgi:hypothetical protein
VPTPFITAVVLGTALYPPGSPLIGECIDRWS